MCDLILDPVITTGTRWSVYWARWNQRAPYMLRYHLIMQLWRNCLHYIQPVYTTLLALHHDKQATLSVWPHKPQTHDRTCPAWTLLASRTLWLEVVLVDCVTTNNGSTTYGCVPFNFISLGASMSVYNL